VGEGILGGWEEAEPGVGGRGSGGRSGMGSGVRVGRGAGCDPKAVGQEGAQR
jgi:hypothetical protein